MGFPKIPLRDSTINHARDSSDNGSGGQSVPVKPLDSNLYLLTAEYLPGYDFITDTLKGVAGVCVLRVYKNFMPYRTVEVSDEDEVCADADRCFLVGGDLYTAFSGPARTVIRRNGEELFSLPRGQTVIGLEVIENKIYTLSYNASEWMFSMDGKTIRSGLGEIMRNLYDDDGTPCFAWMDAEGCHICYGCYDDVHVEMVDPPGLPVNDVCHVGNLGTIVLSHLSPMIVISMRKSSSEKWENLTFSEVAGFQGLGGISLIPEKDGFYCLGELSDGHGGRSNAGVVVYEQGGIDFVMEDGPCMLPQLHVFAGYSAFVTGHHTDGRIMAFSRHYYYEYPERYISSRGSMMFKDELYLALGMNIPDTPVNIYRGESREKVLEINGLPLAFSKD